MRIWTALVLIFNTIDNAESEISVSTEIYVSFFSVHWVENLLTQYFKKRGIPTYNLQHGLIFYQAANPLDILQHTGIESDYHLAWGEYTKNDFLAHGINEPKILIAGYPKKAAIRSLKAPANKICLVFLSRQDYSAENKVLLNLLTELNNRYQTGGFTFFLKLHPNLSFDEYHNYINKMADGFAFNVLSKSLSLQNVFDTVQPDFCITVNSTTYYECYLNGYISLRYHTKVFDKFFGLADDEFNDCDGLCSTVNKLYSNFYDIFDEQAIRKKLNYVIGCDEDHYSAILNQPVSNGNIS